jgi:hypothetical protein
MESPSPQGQTPSQPYPPPYPTQWGRAPSFPRPAPAGGVSSGIAVELFGIAVALFGLASGSLSFGGGAAYQPNSFITGAGALIAFIGLVMHFARI